MKPTARFSSLALRLRSAERLASLPVARALATGAAIGFLAVAVSLYLT